MENALKFCKMGRGEGGKDGGVRAMVVLRARISTEAEWGADRWEARGILSCLAPTTWEKVWRERGRGGLRERNLSLPFCVTPTPRLNTATYVPAKRVSAGRERERETENSSRHG